MKKIILFNIVIILALMIYMNEFVITDDVLANSLGEQLSSSQIDSILEVSKKFAWIDYSLAVLGYLLKVSCISALVYLILMLNEKGVAYSEAFKVVAESFSIFLIPLVIKVLVLSASPNTISLEQIQYFSFGSLLNLFGSDGMDNWLKTLLQSINIWEIVFLILLAFQLKKYFNNSLQESLKNSLISYGSGWMVWTIFVVFLAITFS